LLCNAALVWFHNLCERAEFGNSELVEGLLAMMVSAGSTRTSNRGDGGRQLNRPECWQDLVRVPAGTSLLGTLKTPNFDKLPPGVCVHKSLIEGYFSEPSGGRRDGFTCFQDREGNIVFASLTERWLIYSKDGGWFRSHQYRSPNVCFDDTIPDAVALSRNQASPLDKLVATVGLSSVLSFDLSPYSVRAVNLGADPLSLTANEIDYEFATQNPKNPYVRFFAGNPEASAQTFQNLRGQHVNIIVCPETAGAKPYIAPQRIAMTNALKASTEHREWKELLEDAQSAAETDPDKSYVSFLLEDSSGNSCKTQPEELYDREGESSGANLANYFAQLKDSVKVKAIFLSSPRAGHPIPGNVLEFLGRYQHVGEVSAILLPNHGRDDYCFVASSKVANSGSIAE
jgi:hypothetical protein